MDSARPPQPKNVSYEYDALGRRISRTSGAQWTRFTYDGDDVVLDQNSDGTQVYYGNGPGVDNKLWYTQQGSASVFFLKDHLNSTRALVSSSGTIIPGSEIDYDSFGYSTTQIPTRYRYTGREYDPDTELYYYRARWYDPQARRFISEDPIGLEGGINLYAYVGNNPLNFTDPDGTIPIETIADIIGIGVDITSLYDDPSWTNVAFLGWSIGAAVTPYVPGSWTARACKGANNARKLLTAPKTVKHHIFIAARG